MMLSRNLLTHTYDFAVFEKVLVEIGGSYLPAMSALNEFFLERRLEP
jgi:hypothetical protein